MIRLPMIMIIVGLRPGGRAGESVPRHRGRDARAAGRRGRSHGPSPLRARAAAAAAAWQAASYYL